MELVTPSETATMAQAIAASMAAAGAGKPMTARAGYIATARMLNSQAPVLKGMVLALMRLYSAESYQE